MKNKILLIVVLIVVVLVGGYLLYAKNLSDKQIEVQNTNTNTDNNQASGKLNINVVCEGSLAYMTFTDGASADKFVAECKEGKHPEVIERYKAQMNVGSGANI